MKISKSVDKSYATLGEFLTYTVVVTNDIPQQITNVLIKDPLPSGTTYADGLTVTPSNYTGSDPMTGLTITSIDSGDIVTITWKVKVGSILPVPNPIENKASAQANSTLIYSDPPTQTKINYADLISDGNFVKEVDKEYAAVGDILTYTIKVKNTGNTNADSVIVTDLIETGTSLVSNSLTVDAVYTNISPDLTINLTNPIVPNSTVTIKYQVKVDALPVSDIINNQADISYKYVVDPILNITQSASGKTNIVETIINTADLISSGNFKKSVDKVYADLGDILTYTFLITNTGNVEANNVMLTDPIPNGTSLISGSISSNVLFLGTNPTTGITFINAIQPNEIVMLSYKVKINSIPTPNPIPNQGSIKYTYIVDPNDESGATAVGNSNLVNTKVNHGEIFNPEKSVDRNQTTPGDILVYSVVLNNTGNVSVNNVVIKDIMPVGVKFILNSVEIDGNPSPGQDPNLGIVVGSINTNSTKTITFDVEVLQDAPDILTNIGTVYYDYVVNPKNPAVEQIVDTNVVNVDVLFAKATLIKSAESDVAYIGDTIKYSILVINDGDVELKEVVLQDPLSSDVIYKDNLTIDNILKIGADITSGVNIGDIPVGGQKVVAFEAQVVDFPPNIVADNISKATYEYTALARTFDGVSYSNKLSINIYTKDIKITKVNNKSIVKVGDIFTYTIDVQNVGKVNIYNTKVFDSIPGALKVIGITVDGVSTSDSLITGINLGTLAPGQLKIIELTTEVLGDIDETFNNITEVIGLVVDPNSNKIAVKAIGEDIIGITVYNPQLTLRKKANKQYAVNNEIVKYEICASNTGDISLGGVGVEPIIVYDVLAEGLEFIPGSVEIDNVSQPSDGIVEGVNIGFLDVGQKKTISFDVKVVDNKVSPIENQSHSTFGFILPGTKTPQISSTTSNIAKLYVEVAEIDIVKKADKKFVVLDDTITYTVILTNKGTLDANNVIFKDVLPEEVELIQGSFKVNDKVINSVNLYAGVNIGDVPINKPVIVQYTVKLINPNCKMKIQNCANVEFYYVLPDGNTGNAQSKQTENSCNTIDIGISNFKQLSIEQYVKIPNQKPDIEQMNNVTGKIEIRKCHIIDTPISQSQEEQRLTGHKLIIHGFLNLSVEYTACDDEQSVHSAHYDIPFSTFIVLPKNYVIGSKVDIEGEIEDIYNNQVNCRVVFVNTTTLINVKIRKPC